MKEANSLWKVTAQAALIGLAGTAAMIGTEMMLFPGLAPTDDDKPACVETSCRNSETVAPAGAG